MGVSTGLRNENGPLYAQSMSSTVTPRAKKPPQLRGERLVEKILEAAVEEMAAKGVARLSMEEVAERAGVAKTTVYRRWATRAELAVAAMTRVADRIIDVADTGTLRGDLERLLLSYRDFAATPQGMSLIRMMLSERADPDIDAFVCHVREDRAHEPEAIVARAVARGELPAGTDARLLLDVAVGAVEHYVCFVNEPVSDARVRQIVELVLVGAEHGGSNLPSRSPSAREREGRTPAEARTPVEPRTTRGGRRPNRF